MAQDPKRLKLTVEQFDENFPAKIVMCLECHGLVCRPASLRCGHLFCLACIREKLKEHPNCPACEAPVDEEPFEIPVIHDILQQLQVSCENSRKGCKAKFKVEELERHLAVCEYRLTCCRSPGCGVRLMQKDMKGHMNTCPLRIVVCNKTCKLSMTATEYRTHRCLKRMRDKVADLTKRLEDK